MKKILCLLLILVLAFTIMACGKEEPKVTPDVPEIENGIKGDDNDDSKPEDSTDKPSDDKNEPADDKNKPIEKPAIIEEKVDHGESLAAVNLNGKWGYINTSGEFVIEPQYSQAHAFNYGAAVVEIEEKPILINKKNEVLFKSDLEHLDIKSGIEGMFKTNLYTKYGFINYKGEVIAEPIYYNLGDFSSGLCVALGSPHDGYINKAGEFVIEPAYNDAEDFSEGFAIVWKNGKCGFINTDGEPLTDMIYDDATAFSDGMAKIRVGKKWGFIDTTGKVVIEPQFEHYISNFSEGLASFLVHNEEEDVNYFGYIDKTGKVVIEPKFDTAEDFLGGRARVALLENGKFYDTFIDKNGEFITDVKYEQVESFSEGLAAVSDGDNWGFINTNGEVVVDLIYDDVDVFSNGLAAVGIYNDEIDDCLYGYVNKTGEMVIDPIFRYVQAFEVIPEE